MNHPTFFEVVRRICRQIIYPPAPFSSVAKSGNARLVVAQSADSQHRVGSQAVLRRMNAAFRPDVKARLISRP